ncbi:MAG: class I SAM-dependent methyltransferase [Candidatus Binatia bacterium]
MAESPKRYLKAFVRVLVGSLFIVVVIAITNFPYDSDAPFTYEEMAAARKFYTEAYSQSFLDNRERFESEAEYIDGIKDQIAAFVKSYNLDNRAVLDVGSGGGYLQDMVRNYTGLDISPTAARFYHKKFVVGSATAMPFQDGSFEGAWSIAVLEHIPNPEQALYETRRVLKDNGVLFLFPSWNFRSWAADGYDVRPYSDFGLSGKLIKASIPLRSSVAFRLASLIPNRLIRTAAARFGPTKLHYRRLVPNYERYWVPDSDAVASIDSHEAMLWFLSRGDSCLNCENASLLLGLGPLIIRVHKSGR